MLHLTWYSSNRKKNQLKLKRSVWNKLCFVHKDKFKKILLTAPSPNNLQVTYPNATAEANDSPKAADFPRPRAAVSVTVLLNVFSDIASTNLRTAFAWE